MVTLPCDEDACPPVPLCTLMLLCVQRSVFFSGIPNACPNGSPVSDLATGLLHTCNPVDITRLETCKVRVYKELFRRCPAGHYCKTIGLTSLGGVCCPLVADGLETSSLDRPTCPNHPLMPIDNSITNLAECRNECVAHKDCPAAQSCCFNGCGLSCLAASVGGGAVTVNPRQSTTGRNVVQTTVLTNTILSELSH